MVNTTTKNLRSSRWSQVRIVLLLGVLAWIAADPKAFINLWLTPDQQARVWFELGDYERASRTFENPRWRGFSLYAGEDFANAEIYFSQYQDADSLLARANAMAHQRKYLDAKREYQELGNRYPDHPAPAVNLPIIEALIEADKQTTADKEGEKGGRKTKAGQGSNSSEGNEGQEGLELEQLNAEQLLQDPGLTDMWLRQIQRDPSEFLVTKFYLQLEQEEEGTP